MATLSVQTPVPAGSTVALVAAGAGGDVWPQSGLEMFICDNAGASPVTLTFECFKVCDVGGILHPIVQTVAAGTREFYPPFSSYYRSPQGMVSVTYSAVTSVTVGVVKAV